MEADFSGWATKANLKCSDGRTIMPNAFKHQDTHKVPLVWQHGHSDPTNVVGHAILENREEGVYAYGFFNNTEKAAHAKELVKHKDIQAMSIWANELIEKAGRVLHGAIREVSLVLSGANPGALIENVTIRHSDGDEFTLEDEVIIHTGLGITLDEEETDDEVIEGGDASHSDDQEEEDDDESTLSHQEIYDSMNDEQKELFHTLLEEALDDNDTVISHKDLGEDATVKDVYESLSDQQKDVVHYMIGVAVEEAMSKSAKHDNIDQEGTNTMGYNVFETNEDPAHVVSHDDLKGIVADATKTGSFKEAVENYALAHNITNIDQLFPDAQAIDKTPEWLARRTEWVESFLSGTRKTPFSRIKTLHADITVEEARAKGYVTGNLKKEEFFAVSKRVTTPTTVYKKQKLDRDDMVDITDFDVVTWLKAEMRLMLDEEIARAALIGDGRDVAHEDKINEQNIRPIATDHSLYTTTVNVNVDDANSSVQEIIDAIVMHRQYYKGSGMPTMFTTESYIAKFLLLKDTVGRRIYKTLDELAQELRVSRIVPVEVMEEVDDLVAVIVNPADYVMGATAGGQVSMFDDFDIDYNQHKYLIETRLCGALTKLKSALVVRKVAQSLVLAEPVEPTFDESTGNVTITDVTGVIYKNADTEAVLTNVGSPYAVADGSSLTVKVEADTGYYLANPNQTWRFYYDAVG